MSPVAPRVSKSTNDDFDSLVRVDVVNEIVPSMLYDSWNVFLIQLRIYYIC
jgi:hypothetical protein